MGNTPDQQTAVMIHRTKVRWMGASASVQGLIKRSQPEEVNRKPKR
jgi:hypothetical protein